MRLVLVPEKSSESALLRIGLASRKDMNSKGRVPASAQDSARPNGFPSATIVIDILVESAYATRSASFITNPRNRPFARRFRISARKTKAHRSVTPMSSKRLISSLIVAGSSTSATPLFDIYQRIFEQPGYAFPIRSRWRLPVLDSIPRSKRWPPSELRCVR